MTAIWKKFVCCFYFLYQNLNRVLQKKTPLWVATNTTSKKGLKGRLVVVVVAVVGSYKISFLANIKKAA
jgi:hypothetical protein